MKTISCCMAAAFGAALTLSAKADLFESFDSYADNASFSAVWIPTIGAGLSLNASEFISSPNSVKNPGTAGQSNRRQIAPMFAHSLDFSFDFYDYTGGAGRDYVSLYARGGAGDWTDPLNNILSIGKYDAVTATKYAGRLAFPGDAIFGDGAFGNAGGWFALGGAPDLSLGWHNARITGEWDSAHPGQVIYKFYMDGILGGSAANTFDDAYNWVVIGSGLSTVPSGIAIDDLSITTIPEPSTAALLAWAVSGAGLFRGKWL